jgi:hypothetical protein
MPGELGEFSDAAVYSS